MKYGEGKVIFVEHLNDLFAAGVSDDWIKAIIGHTRQYPDNTYVWQTKNPARYHAYESLMGGRDLFGTTIETNRPMDTSISCAPQAHERAYAMVKLDRRKFLTFEPIIECDPSVLIQWAVEIKPEFVNLGADSKRSNLPEPSAEKIKELIRGLTANHIPIRVKRSLERLLK